MRLLENLYWTDYLIYSTVITQQLLEKSRNCTQLCTNVLFITVFSNFLEDCDRFLFETYVFYFNLLNMLTLLEIQDTFVPCYSM
jgi:hypothetical protein